MGQYQTVKRMCNWNPKGKEIEWGGKIKEIVAEKCSNLIKDTKTQFKKAQRKPNLINKKEIHPYDKIAEN